MRVLLLSLYYPPLNTIAAQRISSFEKELTAQGITVDVITRYYDAAQQQGKSMFLGQEAASGFDKDYIREGNVIYTNFKPANPKLAFSARLPPLVKGVYNYFQVDVFHYGWLSYAMEAFEKEFREHAYDFIISSYGPPVAMLLAKKMSEQYNIPFMIDFRDSYINEQDVSFHLFMKRLILDRTLKNAAGIIFSTEGMKNYFHKKVSPPLRQIPCCTVYNGVEATGEQPVVDASAFDGLKKIREKYALLLLHTGTLYEGQNISFFIDGLKKYNAENQQQAALVFLGLAENNIRQLPAHDFMYYLPKVDHATALLFQKEASALLLPIWNGRYTGFSGKTQEYLFSGNYIITSPGPQEDLYAFLELSPNVRISSDENEFVKIMKELAAGINPKLPLKSTEQLYRSYWIRQLGRFLQELK